MTTTTSPIPEGFHTVTPFLIVRDIEQAIAFYKTAFTATELNRYVDDDNRLKNVELKIGDSPIMVSQHETVEVNEDRTLNNLPVISIYLYVEDADQLFQQAIATGARELYPVQLQSYGNREGAVADPFGNFWWIGTKV
ncbi:MAG: VOC family protein [Chloroflexota bacterium]